MMLVRGLKKHRFPAIGFVNESKLTGRSRPPDRQSQPLAGAGMDLGNHTYSHESPNDLGADRYIADIAKGEPVTSGLLAQHGKTMHYFRHPYLETGSPGAVKDAIDGWLATMATPSPRSPSMPMTGNSRSPMTMPSPAMTSRAASGPARISGLYRSARSAGISAPPMTCSGARSPMSCCCMIRAQRRRFEALAADPQTPPPEARHAGTGAERPRLSHPRSYTGKDGIDWVERWSDELHKTMPWSTWQDPPKQIEDEYEKTEHDRH
jgi:hypothetical protein